MKIKFMLMLVSASILVSSLSASAQEKKNNFLSLRYEYGQENDSDLNFSKQELYFENSSLENWKLGAKIISGDDSYKQINPHAYWQLNPNFFIGGKYFSDSAGSELLGPTFRYINTLGGKIFTIFEVIQYFDTKNENDTTDIWLSVSNAKKNGLLYGFEIVYFNIRNGTENLKIRPLKIGYKFQNGIFPYFMLQRHWNNIGNKADSIFIGFTVSF